MILIDELVAYVRQFEEGKTLTGGTFDSNLSFVQALTEALKAVPTAVLPESDKEAGSQRGVKALEALAHSFGRVQAPWKPVATEEAFEIVRRRLFASINDKLAMESVCRAFADFYIAHRDDFPQETQESRYFERLVHAYPIHPEVFDRLYEDWSTLDNFQRTRGVLKMMANASLEQAEETVRRMIRETYKWLVAPMQEARPGKGLSELRWEHFQVNPGAQNWSQEIERVLKENELLINEWAPIHLVKVLKDWFWKDDVKETSALNVWQQSCQQLYLPRLKDDTVFQMTLAAGAESRDFFGFAQGKEDGRYVGFSYGKRTSPILDSSLLLIEPFAAAAYMEALRAAEEASRAKAAEAGGGASTTSVPAGGGTPRAEDSTKGGYATGGTTRRQSVKKQFYGSIELDPFLAKKQFADLVDEVVQQFTMRPGVKVKIAIEIQAESATGFDDGLQRAVKENCNVLKFKNAEFEE